MSFVSYYADNPADVSLERNVVALRDAQVFMALISDNYVNDKRCSDLLLYAHVTLNKPLLLVVLDQGQDWKKSKIGILVSDQVFLL